MWDTNIAGVDYVCECGWGIFRQTMGYIYQIEPGVVVLCVGVMMFGYYRCI